MSVHSTAASRDREAPRGPGRRAPRGIALRGVFRSAARGALGALLDLPVLRSRGGTASPDLLDPVRRKVRELADLEPDWDGEGGRPATPEAVRGALALLDAIPLHLRAGAEVPYAFPGSDGSVGVSWELDERNFDLGVCFTPEGLLMWYGVARWLGETKAGGEEVALDGGNLPGELRRFLRAVPRAS